MDFPFSPQFQHWVFPLQLLVKIEGSTSYETVAGNRKLYYKSPTWFGLATSIVDILACPNFCCCCYVLWLWRNGPNGAVLDFYIGWDRGEISTTRCATGDIWISKNEMNLYERNAFSKFQIRSRYLTLQGHISKNNRWPAIFLIRNVDGGRQEDEINRPVQPWRAEGRESLALEKSTKVWRTTAKSDHHSRFVHILFPMGNHTETSPGGLLLGKPISRAVVHRRICHTTHSHRHTFYITQSYITHVRLRFLPS